MQYSILIAEDDLDIQSLLKLYLGNAGFRVFTADNGRSALSILQEEHIDLALLDIMMPEANGYQVMEELRKTSNIPVLFLSAKDQDYDRILGLNLGADAYLTKPFNPLEVVAQVQAALRRFYRLGSGEQHEGTVFRLGALTLDLERMRLLKEGRTVDRLALDFASKVKREASRPVSIKIGSRYSSLANMIKGFDVIGIDALVLFNRFYRPDIDIESMTLSQAANPLSSSHEYAESLRWIALMSGEVKCDLCASTGIHEGETMIKMLLAGASACQICTAALKDLSIIRTMCDTLSAWMSRHGFSSISDFRGRLAQENMEETGLWERTQYIKKLSGSN